MKTDYIRHANNSVYSIVFNWTPVDYIRIRYIIEEK